MEAAALRSRPGGNPLRAHGRRQPLDRAQDGAQVAFQSGVNRTGPILRSCARWRSWQRTAAHRHNLLAAAEVAHLAPQLANPPPLVVQVPSSVVTHHTGWRSRTSWEANMTGAICGRAMPIMPAGWYPFRSAEFAENVGRYPSR